MRDRRTWILSAAVVAVCLAPSSAVMPSEVFAGQELKAAVADSERGFAAHKGTLLVSASPAILPSKTYQAKKTMTGAKTCRVVDVSLDEPQMQVRQTGYSCQYPGVFKLDKAL